MQRIHVALGQPYDILIGPGLLVRLPEWLAPLRPTRVLVVTNSTVAPLFVDALLPALSALAPIAVHVLPDGEVHKTLAAVQSILDALVAQGADRKSVVVALGGGVVGDTAGFAAAVYMRGIRVVQVPT
ncbi:MAG: iron-containing alcohol dehydrogenase, partial [Burkholderiales bacterium]|nr:iron-containing alcohol dehydrogenase [Burkholderiales bacterium]